VSPTALVRQENLVVRRKHGVETMSEAQNDSCDKTQTVVLPYLQDFVCFVIFSLSGGYIQY
jgi:urease accessory protein UreH